MTHISAHECPQCRRSAIDPIFVSRKDAAVALALSVRSIDYLIAAGELKVRRIGGRILIAVKELQRFSRRDHLDVLVPSSGV